MSPPWPVGNAFCPTIFHCSYPCLECVDDPETERDETGRLFWDNNLDPINHSYEMLYCENNPHASRLYLVTDNEVDEDLTSNPLELSLDVKNGTYNVWILNWYQHAGRKKSMDVTIEGITATAVDVPGDLPEIEGLYNGLFWNFEIEIFEVTDGEINIVLGEPEGGNGMISFTGFDIAPARPPDLPGDLDGDGDVDFQDFSILAFNFTGTITPPEPPGTGGKLPEEGDVDGDGDMDFTDFFSLAFNFTGTITAPASDAPEEDDVHLEIDLTKGGTMTLQPTNANLAGYSIRSPDSQLVPDADRMVAPFMFYLLNAAQEVTAGSVGTTTMLTEALALAISFEGDADQATDVVFQYTRAGEVTQVDGLVHVIPEPATMILLTASGLMVMPHRRHRLAHCGESR